MFPLDKSGDSSLFCLNSFNSKYWTMYTAWSITKQQASQFVIASISVCPTSNIKRLYHYVHRKSTCSLIIKQAVIKYPLSPAHQPLLNPPYAAHVTWWQAIVYMCVCIYTISTKWQLTVPAKIQFHLRLWLLCLRMVLDFKTGKYC